MRSAVGCVSLWLAALLAGSSLSVLSAPARLDSVRIGGRDYVRASQWASARGLKARWLSRSAQFSSAGSTLLLKADAREAQINGVQVWLSFPVVQRGGNFFISRLDCQSTLEPILFPARAAAGVKVRTICLDPGHGGRDPGNQVGSHQEKTYCLLLAQELSSQLTRAGFTVIQTRARDTYVDLGWRPLLAKRRKADLFVSLHFNAVGTSRGTVRGSEVYCLAPPGAASTNARDVRASSQWSTGSRYNAQSTLLAYKVQKALTQTLPVEDRGVRRARFVVLRDAALPAVLVEAGFMSHPTEGKKIFTAEYRRQIARAITSGLTEYKRTVERN